FLSKRGELPESEVSKPKQKRPRNVKREAVVVVQKSENEDSDVDIGEIEQPPVISDLLIEPDSPVTETRTSHWLETLPEPTEERTVNQFSIEEEERLCNPEFFCGNPVKTPERYLHLRKSILDAWEQTRPNYLSKTAVRQSLV